jgi:hypothetical protein
MKEILNIEFDWSLKPDEQQIKRLKEFSNNPDRVRLDDDGTLNWASKDFEITLDEAFSVSDKFRVTGRTKMARLVDIEDEIDHISNTKGRVAPVNQKCNVVVAGTSVLEITEVQLASDCCTDSLQRQLENGWRILAICVQPDQRRPDYIMGKVDRK